MKETKQSTSTTKQGKSNQVDIKVLKVGTNGNLPVQATPTAVGFDVYAAANLRLIGHSKIKLPLGIALEIPPEYYIQISERSGLATRENIFIKAGIIDPDYRGEVMVVLANHGPTPIDISTGDKIAQFVLHRRIGATFKWVKKLNATERGEDGFGSTDTRN